MDYASLLYDPIYSTIGVEATFTPDGGTPVTLTAIDKTIGVEVGEGSGDVAVQTVKPGATIRVAELLERGLTVDLLDDGLLEFNGSVWDVISHIMRPSPKGEAEGEVLLILRQAEAPEQSTETV